MTGDYTVTRTKVHTREVLCEAFERSDGLWDIVAYLTDIKTFDWRNRDRGGVIAAGEPLHDMSLCLTLDLDYKIHHVIAQIHYAPQNVCADIVDNYSILVGHTIGPGWTRLTKELLGGVSGCTHLRELLGPIATTAYQALIKPRTLRSLALKGMLPEGEPLIFGSPEVINTCHAWSESGAAVEEFWPQYYQPDFSSE